jgi:hypothetical protein
MPTDNSCCTVGGLPTPTINAPATPFDPCADATRVIVCAPDPVPFTLTGQDCAGSPVDTLVEPGQGGLAVQPAGHVYSVKLCQPTGLFDREPFVLCAPDGTKVWVQDVTPQEAPLGTAPTFEAYDLNGAPWAGDKSTLVDCGQEKIDLGAAEFFCDAGQTITRTTVWDISVQPAAVLGNIWQDVAGNVVAAPGAPTAGACSVERPVLIYLERNPGVVSMADIVAAAGTNKIQSVTVKQVLGLGSVNADSGSGVPLSVGEVWSWSALTGADSWDYLGLSALTMDAGGGEQRITATYI